MFLINEVKLVFEKCLAQAVEPSSSLSELAQIDCISKRTNFINFTCFSRPRNTCIKVVYMIRYTHVK